LNAAAGSLALAGALKFYLEFVRFISFYFYEIELTLSRYSN